MFCLFSCLFLFPVANGNQRLEGSILRWFPLPPERLRGSALKVPRGKKESLFSPEGIYILKGLENERLGQNPCPGVAYREGWLLGYVFGEHIP